MLSVVALAQDSRRVGQLGLEVWCGRDRRDLLPFDHVAAHRVEIAVAAPSGVDEVGERVATQVGVERHIVVVEESRQALVGIGVVASGEFGPTARKRDKREERRCPER